MASENKMVLMIVTIFTVLIAVLILFELLGNTSHDLVSAGQAITDANNCSMASFTGLPNSYNISNGYCYRTNSTSGATVQLYVAKQYDLPLNALFASNGVIFLVLMAAIVLLIFGLVGFKTLVKK